MKIYNLQLECDLVQTITRYVADTLTKLQVKIVDLNLSGLSVSLNIHSEAGDLITAGAPVTVLDAVTGLCQYDFADGAPTEPGRYFLSFVATDGEGLVTYPDRHHLILQLHIAA